MFKRAIQVLAITLVLILGTSVTVVASSSFSDVRPGDWHYTTIMNMANQGVVSGFPDGTFRPNANISRIEFYTMLTNLLIKEFLEMQVARGISEANISVAEFRESISVPGENNYYRTIMVLNETQNFWGNGTLAMISIKAQAVGQIRGLKHGTPFKSVGGVMWDERFGVNRPYEYFSEGHLGRVIKRGEGWDERVVAYEWQTHVDSWNRPITRDEMMWALVVNLGESRSDIFNVYYGVSNLIGDYSIDMPFPPIALFQAGIITGDANSNLNINNNATRAEVATILARAFNRDLRAQVTIPPYSGPRMDGQSFSTDDPLRGPLLPGARLNGVVLEMGRDGRLGSDQIIPGLPVDAWESNFPLGVDYGRVGMGTPGAILSGGVILGQPLRTRVVIMEDLIDSVNNIEVNDWWNW